MNFDDMTISQLKKLTEQYERILKENKILRAKFPTKIKRKDDLGILKELGIKWF